MPQALQHEVPTTQLYPAGGGADGGVPLATATVPGAHCAHPRALVNSAAPGGPRPRADAALMLVPLAGGGQETLLSKVGLVHQRGTTTAPLCSTVLSSATLHMPAPKRRC